MLSSLVKKAINRVARLGDRLTEDMHFLLRGIQFSPSTVDPADTCLSNSAFDRAHGHAHGGIFSIEKFLV